MSLASAILLTRQLALVLKAHDGGAKHSPVGQKFSDVAEAQIGIPFVMLQAPRTGALLQSKSPARKDWKSRERNADSSDEPPTNGRHLRRNPGQVDVSV
jgi:hypothetical protein